MPTAKANLGYPVTFRNYSLEEMVSRAWGSSFRAPDHGVYQWSNGRKFDSTDIGFTGIYGPRVSAPSGGITPPPPPGAPTADSTLYSADTTLFTADQT